jgi:hypothetical protein
MVLDELLLSMSRSSPWAALTTTITTSSIDSMHGFVDSEQDPGQAAREEAPDAALLDLSM